MEWRWSRVGLVPAMPPWSGDIHEHQFRVLKNISPIDLCRFYGQYFSMSFRGYSRSEQCKGLFKPVVSSIRG